MIHKINLSGVVFTTQVGDDRGIFRLGSGLDGGNMKTYSYSRDDMICLASLIINTIKEYDSVKVESFF